MFNSSEEYSYKELSRNIFYKYSLHVLFSKNWIRLYFTKLDIINFITDKEGDYHSFTF